MILVFKNATWNSSFVTMPNFLTRCSILYGLIEPHSYTLPIKTASKNLLRVLAPRKLTWEKFWLQAPTLFGAGGVRRSSTFFLCAH